MKLFLDRGLRSNLLRSGILALVVGLLVGGPFLLLGKSRALVSDMQSEIDSKKADLVARSQAADRGASLGEMESSLSTWRELAGSEALRFQELSSIARTSGVLLAGLEALDPIVRAGGSALACPYRLSLRGRYEQLANFCAGVSSARGLAAVEELRIASAEADGSGVLNASLSVAWYAPNPTAPGEAGATPP